MAELEGERARTNEVQRQLNLAMNLNTELKLSTGLLAEEIVEDEQRRLFSLKMKVDVLLLCCKFAAVACQDVQL